MSAIFGGPIIQPIGPQPKLPFGGGSVILPVNVPGAGVVAAPILGGLPSSPRGLGDLGSINPPAAPSAPSASSTKSPSAGQSSVASYANWSPYATQNAFASIGGSGVNWKNIIILAAILLGAVMAFGQTDSTIHVKAFPGTTVGQKVSNAMATCTTNTAVPCILVIDPTLAAAPAGTMPTLCTNCFLEDYRSGGMAMQGSDVTFNTVAAGTISASSIGLLGNFQMNSGQGINFFSDSTCDRGTGATAAQRAWAMMVAAATSPTAAMHCTSGYQMSDIIGVLTLPGIVLPATSAPVSVLEGSINDAGQSYAMNSNQLVFWQQMAYLETTYLATPFAAAIHGDDSAQITQTGWTLSNQYGVNMGLATSTANSSLSFSITTYGGPIVVMQGVWNADTGTDTVTIDGSLATDTITNSSTLNNAPYGGATLYPFETHNTNSAVAARFPVAAGTHTVTFTCVTPGTHGCLFLEAYTSQQWKGTYQPPVAVVIGTPYTNNDTGSAATAQYDTMSLNTAALAKSDGFNLYSVNLRANMNSTTSMTGTGANVSGLQVTDGAMTSGSNQFTSSQASFSAQSVGKYVIVAGAGPNPGGASNTALAAKITTYVNSTTVDLEFPAAATVSGATSWIGFLGQVIPPSTAVGYHPNDYGHAQWANDVLAVINPSATGKSGTGSEFQIPESTGNIANSPSNIGWTGSFHTAGNSDADGALNQGYCAFNTGARFGCFGWGAYTTTGISDIRGPYIAFDGGQGSADYAGFFNIFPNAKPWAGSEMDLGAPGFSVDHGGTYLNGFTGAGAVLVEPSGTATASQNYGSNAFQLAAWSVYNGSGASTGAVIANPSSFAGTNAGQYWIWHGCQGASFICTWYIENFASVQFTEPLYAASDFHLTGGSYLASLAASTTAPTISSGFGTTPTVPSNNGTAAFTVNVGTGGTATSGVMGMPAASHGWACQINDLTNPGANFTKVSATTTTTVTVTNYNSSGTATAWSASDLLVFQCTGY